DGSKHYPIGCGVAQNEKVVFEDVSFENEQTWIDGKTYNVSYYAHNNSDNQSQLKKKNEPASVSFNNCNFNGAEMHLSSISSGFVVNYGFNNCTDIGTLYRYNDDAKLDMRVYIDNKIICELHVPESNDDIEPTCASEGRTGGTHCALCNEAIEPASVIPPLPHTPVTQEAAEPTCTAEGRTQGSYCSVCGEILSPSDIIPPKGHDFGDNEPVCKICGEANPDYIIPVEPSGEKKPNPLSAKGKTVKISYKKLKSKKRIIKRKKAITVKNAIGKVTFKKLKGNKKITVNKSGRITVKKGLKKGVYKIRIRVTARGNADYKKKSKTITVKIKVK
ncbi:MAG: hypothetical protein K6C14_08815, partial [Eubacterium sp.]|nr:hypothetical protein [Eubacterium sp.]